MSADQVWTLPVGHFYSVFCQFLTANVSTVGGALFLSGDVAPPPGLLWYDSHAAGPPLFSLNADFYFSQAKGGVSNTIPYGTPRTAMIFKLFIGGGVSATLTSRDQQTFEHQLRICKQSLENVEEERTPLDLLTN